MHGAHPLTLPMVKPLKPVLSQDQIDNSTSKTQTMSNRGPGNGGVSSQNFSPGSQRSNFENQKRQSGPYNVPTLDVKIHHQRKKNEKKDEKKNDGIEKGEGEVDLSSTRELSMLAPSRNPLASDVSFTSSLLNKQRVSNLHSFLKKLEPETMQQIYISDSPISFVRAQNPGQLHETEQLVRQRLDQVQTQKAQKKALQRAKQWTRMHFSPGKPSMLEYFNSQRDKKLKQKALE